MTFHHLWPVTSTPIFYYTVITSNLLLSAIWGLQNERLQDTLTATLIVAWPHQHR